jgi:hypothetical protein
MTQIISKDELVSSEIGWEFQGYHKGDANGYSVRVAGRHPLRSVAHL